MGRSSILLLLRGWDSLLKLAIEVEGRVLLFTLRKLRARKVLEPFLRLRKNISVGLLTGVARLFAFLYFVSGRLLSLTESPLTFGPQREKGLKPLRSSRRFSQQAPRYTLPLFLPMAKQLRQSGIL